MNVFSRHKGRHCRRLFHLNPSAPQPADDFSRTRAPALAPSPTDADLTPFTASAVYRHPYSPKDAA